MLLAFAFIKNFLSWRLGKYFETLALDIQVVSEGKIKQSWHIEDWSTALDQALYGKPIPDFGLDDAYITY